MSPLHNLDYAGYETTDVERYIAMRSCSMRNESCGDSARDGDHNSTEEPHGVILSTKAT